MSHVSVLPGVPTGVALIAVGERGENQIAVASGANAALGAGEVHGALGEIAAARVLLTSLEIPDEAVVATARAAGERGWALVVNPAPARELPADLVAAHPILVPNEGEARALSGALDAEAAARRLTERTGAPTIVTLGAGGALFLEPGREAAHFAAPQMAVVDTTGAGDAFVGALAAELARDTPFADAARFAVAAAALSVTVDGARDGMPSRRAVIELMRVL